MFSARACLLTGRNHHAVGMRSISNFDTGFPNMRGAIPRSAGTLAEVLRDNGYATYAAGKWHLAPMAECSSVGPFTNWPLQRGFDRFYGFLNGETDQFSPELMHSHMVSPEALSPGAHVLALNVTRDEDGSARAALLVDHALVCEMRIPRLLFVLSSLGMDLGRRVGPVNNDYTAPYVYPGRLVQVVFELGEKAGFGEIKAQMRAELTRQ